MAYVEMVTIQIFMLDYLLRYAQGSRTRQSCEDLHGLTSAAETAKWVFVLHGVGSLQPAACRPCADSCRPPTSCSSLLSR
jgi:hypothetical protein